MSTLSKSQEEDLKSLQQSLERWYVELINERYVDPTCGTRSTLSFRVRRLEMHDVCHGDTWDRERKIIIDVTRTDTETVTKCT